MLECIFCEGEGQVYRYPKKFVKKKIKYLDIKIPPEKIEKFKRKKMIGVCRACRHKYYFNNSCNGDDG